MHGFGEADDVIPVTFHNGGADDLRVKIQEAVPNWKILRTCCSCAMFAWNRATRFSLLSADHRIRIVTGMNLPGIAEAYGAEMILKVATAIVSAAREGIVTHPGPMPADAAPAPAAAASAEPTGAIPPGTVGDGHIKCSCPYRFTSSSWTGCNGVVKTTQPTRIIVCSDGVTDDLRKTLIEQAAPRSQGECRSDRQDHPGRQRSQIRCNQGAASV